MLSTCAVAPDGLLKAHVGPQHMQAKIFCVVLTGSWLKLDEGPDSTLCVLTQYDAYRHEHQIATGQCCSTIAEPVWLLILSTRCSGWM